MMGTIIRKKITLTKYDANCLLINWPIKKKISMPKFQAVTIFLAFTVTAWSENAGEGPQQVWAEQNLIEVDPHPFPE